jgi:hypothetical protein
MIDLIAILEMANVRYCVIMNVLVLLFKRKIFICYHFIKMWIPYVMWMRTYPRLLMRIENERELKIRRWNYGSIVLGHISRGRIDRLVKNEILPPLEFLDLEQCRECIKRKYTKKIKKDTKRSTWILQIIHTDICGPFPVKSVDGYDLFITFTDDYSCFRYIYPIKEKIEMLDKFKIFKTEVEN